MLSAIYRCGVHVYIERGHQRFQLCGIDVVISVLRQDRITIRHGTVILSQYFVTVGRRKLEVVAELTCVYAVCDYSVVFSAPFGSYSGFDFFAFDRVSIIKIIQASPNEIAIPKSAPVVSMQTSKNAGPLPSTNI